MEGWADSEVERMLDAYFEMLRLDLQGAEFSKVDFYRPVSADIGRSDKSVKQKFSNVSAVLSEMSAVFVDGYKARPNIQRLLGAKVAGRLAGDAELRELMQNVAQGAMVAGTTRLGDPSPIPNDIVPPSPRSQHNRRAVIVDFNSLEAQNRKRGLAGELLVLERERRVLSQVGRPDLAERVRHVSVEDGDGLGFDIRSYTPGGQERFLEVKATVRSALQPFYVSANEVEFSDETTDQFSLVRGFQLDREPGFYEMAGSLRKTADLRPDTFVAWPKRGLAG